MYDINLKNVNKGKRFYYIFLIFGILFLLVMAGIFINNRIKASKMDSNTLSSSVEITDYIDDEGNTMYTPIYHYFVKGVEYTCKSNYSSSVNPGNENKLVYYNSLKPSDCVSEYSKNGDVILLAFMLLPVLFISFGIYNIVKIRKKIIKIKELNQRGKLVKNLPYRLEESNIIVNGVPLQKIAVDYTLFNGTVKTLYSEPIHDGKTADSDGMVDLVIDEANPDNYFIDFEINRISGNLPGDYYSSPVSTEFGQNFGNTIINHVDNQNNNIN